MKAIKLISVFVMTLGLTSAVMAKEEKFEENYKVEGPVKNERQIASEKESEREPSSVTPPPEAQTEQAPQPWLHKVDKTDH